jgi:hypothetical protein
MDSMSEMPENALVGATAGATEAPVDPPRTQRLARLLLVPALPPQASPRERVENVLGRELAGFLISALSGSQGRFGSSSP